MKIQFVFDFISPYAYLAWHRLPEVVDAEIEPVPVLLAGLLNHHHTKGPAEIPPKKLYTFKHVVRLAHDYGVPLNPPASHPFNPLLALRLASLPSTTHSVIDRLFKATWVDGVDMSNEAALKEVVPELDFELAQSLENKNRVREQSQNALNRGVFGVPTFLVEKELFFGCDSLPHLARYLGGEDPLTDEHAARWSAVEPSAVRNTK